MGFKMGMTNIATNGCE